MQFFTQKHVVLNESRLPQWGQEGEGAFSIDVDWIGRLNIYVLLESEIFGEVFLQQQCMSVHVL